MIDLSIIIVNWNSAHYLRKCLSTIYSETKDLKFEIIVVDNASYDGCEQIIKNEFPDVIFVQSTRNIGFAKANNLGFKYSSGETLLFLNPDTEIIGPALNQMLSFLQSTPDAGAIGCKLLNSDLSLQTSCVQPYPTILNQVLDIEYLKLRCPRLKLWGVRPLFYNNGGPEEVEVVSGACIMTKRHVFEKAELFSTDYFMYTEDIDLCYKISKAGYKIYYIDDANIVHHGGGSTKNKPENHFGVVLMRESIYKFIAKTRGAPIATFYRLAMFTASFGRMLFIMILLPWATLAGNNRSLFRAFDKWEKVFRWSIGLENWARELTHN